MSVSLPPIGEYLALEDARRRAGFATANGLATTAQGDTTYQHHMGRRGERLMGEVLGVESPPHIGELNKEDIGNDADGTACEVRTTRQSGHLLMKGKDCKCLHRPFIAIHCHPPHPTGELEILGWLWGHEAWERERIGGDGETFWYVAGPFRPLRTLIDLIAERRRAARDTTGAGRT